MPTQMKADSPRQLPSVVDATLASMLDLTRRMAARVGHQATMLDDELTVRVAFMRARHDAASRNRAENAR